MNFIYLCVCREFTGYFVVVVGLQRMQDVSNEIKRVRAQMEENEDLAILMRGLRGQNLKDSLFADDNIKLRLVEVRLFDFLFFMRM